MHNVVSKWAPPNEKGKFVAALLGGNLGTVFTFQLSGILTETIGWRQLFYNQAILVGIVTVLWLICVSNTPSTHRFISTTELQYIEQSLGTSVSKKKVGYFHLHFIFVAAFIACSFAECSTLLENYKVSTILGFATFTLRQLMGSFLPANDCTELYERCSGI